MQTPAPRRKFFKLGPDLRGGGKGHGVRIANKDALTTPGLIIFAPPPEKRYGFAKLPEIPRLIHDPRQGKMPRDLEGLAGYWLISERLKQVFESVDRVGFEFVACDFILADGSIGPQYYLCDVVRVLDAVDEGKSKLKIKYEPSGRKRYSFLGGAHLVFQENVVEGVHIFRTPYSISIFCDNILKEACRSESITGTWFIDAAKM